MNYDFTALCLVRFVSGLIALNVAFLLARRIKSPGAIYLLLFEVAAAIWATGDGFEAAATNIPLKIIWSVFSYTGITTSAVFFFLFALKYSNPSRIIKSRFLILLFIIPFVTMLMAMTNSLHSLLWKQVIINPETNISIYYYGPYFWIHTSYEYLVLTAGLIILFTGSFKVFSFYRPQLWVLIIGTLLPFITSILYVFKLLPVKGIDLTPISFILTGIIIAISLYRFRLFDIMPFARKQALDNLGDGMLITDIDDIIVDYNPAICKLAGLEGDKLYGQNSDLVLHKLGTDHNSFTIFNDNTVEAKKGEGAEESYFEITYHPVSDKFNKEIGKIYLVSDITTRKQIFNAVSESNISRKKEIDEKEKLITDLDAYARSVAHDLKNPIGSVASLTDLIEMKITQDERNEALEMVGMVRDLSYKMISIIDDLLKLSRIRREEIEVVPLRMGSVVEEAMLRLRKEINESRADIDLPSAWPEVMGNSQWLEEVWFNLISNALKYGGKPPVIRIGFRNVSDASIMFTVSDNGNGLSSDSLVKIFRDFERLGRKDIQGHGLGLPIVKRIIDKLGGEVKAESANREGEGCTFSFTLKGCSTAE